MLFGMMRDITDQKDKEMLQADRLILLQTTLNKIVEALGRMTKIRDPYTAGHKIQVARLAKKIGKRVGLDPVHFSVRVNPDIERMVHL